MNDSIKISFYGDFTLGENYQAKYDFKEKVSLLRTKGYDYLFENVKNILQSSDYNIVNLETQITNVQSSSLEGKKAVLHWNDPNIAPKILKKYKISAVSLGNNHGYDFEDAGLKQTIHSLKSENIPYFGAGINEKEAILPYKKEIETGNKKINLYIFGGYKYREDYDKEFGFYAAKDKSGINLLAPKRVDLLIREIKNTDPCAFIVVFPHFGFDLQKTVPMQKEMSRGFIDSGADIIIGHGPHMINQIDYYKSKPIIYSLGNFIFPADFKGKCSPYNLIARLNFTETGYELRLYPIYMENNSKTPQTRLIKQEEIQNVLELLLEGNEELKSKIKQNKDELGIYFQLETKWE